MAVNRSNKSKITEYFGKSPVRIQSKKGSTKSKNESVNGVKEAVNGKCEESVIDIKEDVDKENKESVKSLSTDIEADESHGELVNDVDSSELHFPCSNCDFITDDENVILIHMEECAGVEDIDTQLPITDETMEHDADISFTGNNASLSELQFPCSNCDYFTSDEQEIASHMATCTDLNNSNETPIDIFESKENIFNFNSFTKQNDGLVELHFTCSNCDFIGTSEDEVLVHMTCCTDEYDLKTKPYYTVYKHDLMNKTYKFVYSSQDQIKQTKSQAKVIQKKGADKPKGKQDLKTIRILYSKDTKQKEQDKRKRAQTPKGTVYNQLFKQKKRVLKKEFVCDICDFKTDNKNYIEQHVTTVHSDEKPFECEECGYRCKRQGDLKSHSLVHQEKVRSFICDICNWSTYKKSKLKVHKFAHTGEKPYACPICDYATHKPDGLQSHLKIHSLERPFKCDQCDAAFKQSHNLNAHKKIHTGDQPKHFACELCDYACGTPHVLKNHMLTHTNERPHKCPKCKYTCKIKSNLAVHMLKHTNKKPFVCFECGFATKLPQTLKRHSKIHGREFCAKLDPVKLSLKGLISTAGFKSAASEQNLGEPTYQWEDGEQEPVEVPVENEPEAPLENEPEVPVENEPELPVEKEPIGIELVKNEIIDTESESQV